MSTRSWADVTPARGLRPVLLVGAVVATSTVLLAVRDPHEGGYPLCPLLLLTGLACAGCGGLRATHDLATGDLAGAWAMNPLLVVAVPVLVAVWSVWLVRRVRRLPAWHPPAALLVGVLAAVVVFGVLRNVPALAPYLGPAPG